MTASDSAPVEAITIVLADDHRVVRSGLRVLLESDGRFAVLGEAGDVTSTVEQVREWRPRVLVLDLNMAGESSLDAIPRLRAEWPADDELMNAVVLAADGQSYLNPQFGARLAAQPPEDSPPDNLSPRETEVLTLIALGHTNTEIAASLGVSVRTVESHRAHIQQKIGLTNRAELVRYARQRGLLD